MRWEPRTWRKALGTCLFIGYLLGSSWLVIEAVGVLGLMDYTQLRRPFHSLGVKPVPHLDVSGETYQETAFVWGLESAPIPYRYRTDSRGYRNDVDREAADIYLLGDSIVVGARVPFEKTVTARLEARLGRPAMNVSLLASGLQRQQKRFRRLELALEDRLVLQFLYEGNDLRDSQNYRHRVAGTNRSTWKRRSFAYNFPILLRRTWSAGRREARYRVGEIDGQLYTFGHARRSWVGLEGEIPALRASVESFAREVHEAGGDYVLVFVPTKLRVLGPLCSWPEGSDLVDWTVHLSPLREQVAVWAEAGAIELVDLTDALVHQAQTGKIPWFWGDTHWNATGHDVAARVLADVSAVHRQRPVADRERRTRLGLRAR